MKIVQLHEWTPKQFEAHIEPKNSPLGPKKVKKKNDPVRIEGNKRIGVFALYE